MICNKCGNEINDNEEYCSNCGKRAKSKTISIKFNTLIVAVIFIAIICLSFGIYIVKSKSNNEQFYKIEEERLIENSNKIALDKKYNCTTNNYNGFIVFYNDNTFDIEIGMNNINDITKIRGKYLINENTINLEITYNSLFKIDDTGIMDESFKEYEEQIQIIDYNKIKYKTIDNITFEFELNESIKQEQINNVKTTDKLNNNDFIDRKTFVKNLTDENKKILKQYIVNMKTRNEKNFVDDKFSTIEEEILYTYIYVKNGWLDGITYVITPVEEVPSSLNNYSNELYNYFIVKDVINAVSLSNNEGITDEEIQGALKELNTKIDAQMDEYIERTYINLNPGDEQLKSICGKYISYLIKDYNYIPKDFRQCYSDYQIYDKTKVLNTRVYYKTTKAESYKDLATNEYIGIGLYYNFDRLPLLSHRFKIEELIQTGYVPNTISDKYLVTTPITKKIKQEIDSNNNENLEKICNEKKEYIYKQFGL